MYSKILIKNCGRAVMLGVVASSIAGCAQMTRHSNTLVFGTNTSIGVNVGTDATQTPTIQIGFQRQEAALVPLLANTSESGSNLVPCPASLVDNNPKAPPSGCLFVATSYEGGEITNKDAYSVLASFGGKAKGSGTGAEIAVAQYFATGVAAQQLAESGGANIVVATTATAAAAIANANTAAIKSKVELALVKEKANAAVQVKAIDSAEVAAKGILGKSTDPVLTADLTILAGKFKGAACNLAALQKLDLRTVGQFMVELKAQKRPCLRVWGNTLKQ
ncbi:MAG: hypothetical protein JKY57_04330 [Kordiimonadaceae bacterium]|nr:hypothetical protein [Kordiimonadaceae bacterium]